MKGDIGCHYCGDTGAVACRSRDGTYAFAGPVPDDAKGYFDADCWYCDSGHPPLLLGDGPMKIGDLVRFNHERDGGPVHRVVSIMADGMIELHDMEGYFAPHLFVIADDVAAIPADRTPMQRALDKDVETEDLARINALVTDALFDALPYVEDALKDEGFKPGTVQKIVERIRHALQVAGATDAAIGKEPK